MAVFPRQKQRRAAAMNSEVTKLKCQPSGPLQKSVDPRSKPVPGRGQRIHWVHMAGATLCKPAQVPLLCSRGTGTDKDWWPESRMSVLNSRKLPPDAWASKLQAPGGELPRDRDRQLRVTQDPPKPSPGGAPPSGSSVPVLCPPGPAPASESEEGGHEAGAASPTRCVTGK